MFNSVIYSPIIKHARQTKCVIETWNDLSISHLSHVFCYWRVKCLCGICRNKKSNLIALINYFFRIANDWWLRECPSSDALRFGAPAVDFRRRPKRWHDGAGVARHQRRWTRRRQILLGETHQDRFPRLNIIPTPFPLTLKKTNK